MKTLKKIILASIILLLATSCKKDDLPKATQTGSNNMAAKINGKVWQRKGCFGCIGGGSGISINYDDRTFFGISAQNRDLKYTLTLIIENLKNKTTYTLGNGSGNNKAPNYAKVSSDLSNHINYYTTENLKGKITITKLDTTNKIIAGTFEFKAENENNPSDIITVTNGWFDIKYN
ncbi:DUF6252 family protein [Pedobacter arcticus]|uniref:DUF6252 family protein n=1 Tax=Pedobacter arcticus TaxID=752140 RepID=UPI0002F3A67D|nr:DUF6252 family protein [Pedobacter arcticus]